MSPSSGGVTKSRSRWQTAKPAARLGTCNRGGNQLTGVEALYADMGHFGRKAILRAWYGVVLPGLVLNYFGQGAHVIAHPADVANPFLTLAPEGPLRIGLVLLSVFAAIIASQALISGTYSLIRGRPTRLFPPAESAAHQP